MMIIQQDEETDGLDDGSVYLVLPNDPIKKESLMGIDESLT